MDPWRKKAWNRSLFLKPPLPKSEAFYYVPLLEWYEKERTRAVCKTADPTSHILPECKENYLVFIDGYFQPNLSKIPASLIALPLSSAMKSYGLFLQNRMMRMEKEETEFFAALNGACHGEGLFLYVPPSVSIEAPLQIIHLSTSKGLAFPRVQLVLGKGSSLRIIQTAPSQDAISFIDAILDVGSRLNFYDVSSPPKEVFQMQTFRASLKRDSFLETLFITKGSEAIRNSFKVELLEENCEALLRGISLLSGKNQSHVYGKVEHVAPNCRSRQHFKSILEEKSRSSFEGKIYVHPEAQKTEAYQHSQSLLLSDEAISYAKPNLEIFADDVKASHGATVSQLDREALFYLRSRGLFELEAKSLLIEGFCEEILSCLPFASVREWMR